MYICYWRTWILGNFYWWPSVKKFRELTEFPQPNDSKSLRRFLGMVNFYRKLVPNFSNIILQLTERILLNQKSNSITLTKWEIESFKNIKSCLSSVTVLVFLNSKVSNYQLVTESSNYTVGVAPHQIIDNQPIPTGFFSKKLSQTNAKILL